MATSKKIKSKATSRYHSWIIVGIGIVFCGFGLWYVTRNTSLSTHDKKDLHEKIQAALKDVPGGSPAYSSIEDTGCDSRNSVGLERYVHCDYVALQWLRGDGDLSDKLKVVDAALMDAGWQRTQEALKYEEVFAGSKHLQLRYSKDGLAMWVIFYKSPELSSYGAQGLIAENKLPQLDENEFFYGSRIDTSYWSCRAGAITIQPCPTPPGLVR